MISDGETFWLYSPAQNQQLKGRWKAWLERSHFPVLLLDFIGTFTPERWRKQYKVLYGEYANNEYELRFLPLSTDDPPVTLWISDETFLPVRGRLERTGSRIEVTLSEMKINTGLDDALFKPKLPANTPEIPIQF